MRWFPRPRGRRWKSGHVQGRGPAAPAVSDAGGAQGSKGDRVVTAFGQEMAAEAEHVSPPLEAAELGVGTEPPAGVDQPFSMSAGGIGVQLDRVLRVRRAEVWPVTSVPLVEYLAR